MLEWLRERLSYYASLARPEFPSDMTGGRHLRERFATIYTAGSLAIRYGLLPGIEADLCRCALGLRASACSGM